MLASLSLELMELSREQTDQGLCSKGHQLKNLMALLSSRPWRRKWPSWRPNRNAFAKSG